MFDWIIPVVSFVAVLLSIVAFIVAIKLRRVVPTNMVHIVQSTKQSTPYGRGKDAGNTYYAWPTWLPFIGVSVISYPESIFSIGLEEYEAYDTARLPFNVDIVAFFRVEDANTVAQRVANFEQLQSQLRSVIQGAVRRILATNTLQEIMEARASLGEAFTSEVQDQIAEWGVRTVKTIEFMDLRDASGSKVIAEIMAKEKSRIEKDSRIAVAENKREAQLKEIDAQRQVDVQRQDAEQQVGLRTAEKDQTVGIANEQSKQKVQEQAKTTAERQMAVVQVEQERAAEIKKSVTITNANAAREQAEINAAAQLVTVTKAAEGKLVTDTKSAEGQLAITSKEAEGRELMGKAIASAEESLLMAPVTAQLKLAAEIGSNKEYQSYLLTQEQIRASSAVGLAMAEALAKSDLKIISTGGTEGGSNILGNATGLLDQFGVKGGVNVAGILAGLAATPAGQALVSKLVTQAPAAE